jgi:hypothetical protein
MLNSPGPRRVLGDGMSGCKLGIIFQRVPYALSRVIVVYTTPDDRSVARLFCRYVGVLGVRIGT